MGEVKCERGGRIVREEGKSIQEEEGERDGGGDREGFMWITEKSREVGKTREEEGPSSGAETVKGREKPFLVTVFF